jgi:predicted dehydrogenase
MPDKTRWAVLGTGAIAARFAADMHHSRQGRIVAVGSRSSERAAGFAANLGPGIVTGSFQTLLAQDDIDAVYLATPNERHGEHALAAIAAGKPVLVEKPFALSAAEARTVAEAARQAGVLVMEAMWMRFTPGVVRLKRIIEEGRIGDIRRIDISVAFPQPFDPASPLHDPVNGGALLDLGVYTLSLAVHLAGLPRSVQATVVEAPNGAIAAGGMLLGYDGALATLSCGFDAAGANEAVVTGTSGVARAHRSVLCPPMISLRQTGRTEASALDEVPVAPAAPTSPLAALSSLRPLVAGLKTRRYPTLFLGSGLQYQADHFSDCLRQGLTESPVMPLDQSIAVLDLVERARSAARDGGAARAIS